MAKQKHQKPQFSGMSYREVQRSNSIRRNQLPQSQQTWLKDNGYKNVGWDNVIRLYQKINDLLADSDDDEPTLEELFLEADRIGKKYQTPEEIEAFNQQMAVEVSAIADLIDQQFPEPEGEVMDFSAKAGFRARNRQPRRKRR
jgi:hypothetical protein